MVMAQYRAAYDRQIRIGAQEIVREQFYKVKELHKGVSLDLHGHMLSVEHNAVLIVVHIRGILEAPAAVIDGDGDDPVIFSGRMVQTACVSLILHTEKTFRIAALLCIFSCCDGFRIFFRF